MSKFMCATCGIQYPESGAHPPEHCPICEDERQYLPPGGQQWITTWKLQEGHHDEFRRHEERLRIYGARWDREIPSGAKAAVARSAERYLRFIRS